VPSLCRCSGARSGVWVCACSPPMPDELRQTCSGSCLYLFIPCIWAGMVLEQRRCRICRSIAYMCLIFWVPAFAPCGRASVGGVFLLPDLRLSSLQSRFCDYRVHRVKEIDVHCGCRLTRTRTPPRSDSADGPQHLRHASHDDMDKHAAHASEAAASPQRRHAAAACSCGYAGPTR